MKFGGQHVGNQRHVLIVTEFPSYDRLRFPVLGDRVMDVAFGHIDRPKMQMKIGAGERQSCR